MTATPDWEARYRAADTPWDRGAPSPALEDRLASNPMAGAVLVPGCGSGHDVRAIASSPGVTEVVGLDIAPAAVAQAKTRPAVGPERYELGDLFALPSTWHGRFDWLWEHTCFCAIPPARRADYAAAVAGALRPGGTLLGIFFLDPQNEPGHEGPPFGATLEELDALFTPYFALQAEWAPARTYEGRGGTEWVRLLSRLR